MKSNNKTSWISYNLRHNKELLTDPSGWVNITFLATLSPYLSILSLDETIQNIYNEAKTSIKKRFTISDDKKYIRANNGHSVGLTCPIYLLILQNFDEFLWIVHVTTNKSWQKIQLYGGLSRMSRDYIHFATNHIQLLNNNNNNNNIYLYLNIKAILYDNYKLYLTPNSIIASIVDVPLQYLKIGDRPLDIN